MGSADHLGSTNVVANGSGGLVSRQTYYPFGAPRPTEWNPLPTDYTYTGQKVDASVNLMYYGARYYDAAVGRFLQPDTIVPDWYNPQSLNRYSYVRNNPVTLTDPTGYCDPDECKWTSNNNGGWTITNTGNEVMPGDINLNYLGYDASSIVANRAPDGTYILFGTHSSPYWRLPTRDQAFDAWYDSWCTGLCAIQKALWLAPTRAYYMGYYDEGGSYGGIKYRTELTLGETLHKYTPYMLAFSGGLKVGPAPDFVVTADGSAIPIPNGATGPLSAHSGSGFRYVGGSGGKGLSPEVSDVRIMDPTAAKGPSPGYPGGYASYSNPLGQTVNPFTGKTIAPSDPWCHILLP